MMKNTEEVNDYYTSKIRGRITEDQLSQHIANMKKRSITSDTHKARCVVEDSVNLSSVALDILNQKEIKLEKVTKDEGNLYYVDEYQYQDSKESHVLHFGINPTSEALQVKLEKELKEIGKNQALSISNKTITEDQRQKVKLISVEQEVMKQVVNFFTCNCKTKTVLVNFFARDTQGLKIDKETNSFETHTVVLYNNGKEILVVDPSNPQFSCYLANFDDKYIKTNSSNKTQIYNPVGKPGPNPNQFRDCVDIAVKLAFGLNYDEEVYKDVESVYKSLSVKEITNQTSVYNDLPSVVRQYPLRIKQSSNINHSKKVTLFMKTLKNAEEEVRKKLDNYDYLDGDKEQVRNIVNNTITDNLGECSVKEYDEKIQTLLNLRTECVGKIQEMSQQDLLKIAFNVIDDLYNKK